MEYTKVQTALNHVKDAITTKLDAIKTDVTSVKNSVTNLPSTLDSKFSALTSKVDGVKTDVAGVGSKVDAGVTTLGGKVDGVCTNVNAINQSVRQLNSGIDSVRWYPENAKPAKFLSRKSDTYDSGRKTILDINGAGEIVAFSFGVPYGKPDAIVILTIDGEEYSFKGTDTEARNGFITLFTQQDLSCVLEDAGKIGNVQDYGATYYYLLRVDVEQSDGSIKRTLQDFYSYQNFSLGAYEFFCGNRMTEEEFRAKRMYLCDTDSRLILPKPLRFEKNLKLEADYSGFQYQEDAEIIYRLDE